MKLDWIAGGYWRVGERQGRHGKVGLPNQLPRIRPGQVRYVALIAVGSEQLPSASPIFLPEPALLHSRCDFRVTEALKELQDSL
jgi:hypothetical protein